MRKFNKDVKPNEKKMYLTDTKISKAKEIWGDLYDYSKFEYKGTYFESTVICKEHGEFTIPPALHIKKMHPQGCPICSKINVKRNVEIQRKKTAKTTEQFIKQSKEKFDNQFDYSNTEYYNSNTKVRIKCNKCEEDYLVNPLQHLRFGCSKCNRTKSLKENLIRDYLKEKGVKYFWQYSFEDCVSKNKIPFDFYIPSMNTIIEYNGKHHYKYNAFLHNNDINKFYEQQERDNLKREFCDLNNIKLIEIAYDDNFFETMEAIFS
ncbi:MAG: hypothetical protein BWY04_01309 [candidate division CPR1 bacterium ADurb.Bin160]|uniref:Uncharacterized protein n=1 Tax=candidate division CPR1 bacterium ADurb.Bin160 TaxID=1852826 RepID=A0A1V5ZKQ5_9BACT|nr:MAG: hypothetical protein BWY04_01309 [candidate division CPR1 bacterium ADurb.Bin160]